MKLATKFGHKYMIRLYKVTFSILLFSTIIIGCTSIESVKFIYIYTHKIELIISILRS